LDLGLSIRKFAEPFERRGLLEVSMLAAGHLG
jgi:hypothetical protein